MSDHLFNIIKSKDKDVQTFFFGYYVQRIFEEHPQHIVAILAYGSCLNETTKSSTSTPDFYVVVDNYRLFYQNSLHSFLNRHLPPNIYHLRTNQASSKYCVISTKSLSREVSVKAKDVYHLGRFSKRMGIVWVKDEEAEKTIVKMQAEAVCTVARKVLMDMEKDFMLDEFIERALYISYQGDIRIESSDKVRKLMEAERKYYEDIYQAALMKLGIERNASGLYTHRKSTIQEWIDRLRFQRFISRSKLRAQGRWPKNMLTVDNWLDYMLAKIERTQGIKIELTPKEKKYWYIYGWKYFFRLSKKKLIK